MRLRSSAAIASTFLLLAATAFAQPPAEAMAHWKKGGEAAGAGRYAEAIGELDAVLALVPDDPVVLATRGDMHFRLGHYAGAMADLSAAIRFAGDTPIAVKPLVQRAMLLQSSDMARARADVDHAIAIEPNDAEPHYLMAGLLMRTDVARALQEVDRSIALDPAPGFPYQLRGVLRTATGDFAGARSDLDIAVERQPTSFLSWSGRARLNLESGRPAAARDDAHHALTLPGAQAFDEVTEGLADAELGDVAEAARLLRDAAKRDPRFVAEHAPVPGSAPDDVLARIDRDPARSAKAQLAWGLVAAVRGDAATAQRHFDQAVKADPRLADDAHRARQSFGL